MRKVAVILLALGLLLGGCRPPLVGRCPTWNITCYDDGMTP